MTRNIPTLMAMTCAFAWACSQPPTERVETIRSGVEAVASDAETYAAEAYARAEAALVALEAEIEAQAERMTLVRSYDRAGELAASAEAALDGVREAIASGRDRMRSATKGMVSEARRAIADAQQAMGDLPARVVEPGWNASLAEAEAALRRAESQLGEDLVADAYDGAELAQKRVADLAAAIDAQRSAVEETRAQAAARAARGEVTIPRPVLLDGQQLAAGDYQVRLTDETPPAREGLGAPGQWVEFTVDGRVAGRGLAVVIPADEIGEVAETAVPVDGVRVDELQGGDYVRVWLNRDGVNYLVHLPVRPT